MIRIFGTVAVLGLVAGCYDTPAREPYPGDWTVDDFQHDSGAAQPAGYRLPRLDQWECRPRDSAHPIDKCEVIKDPGSSKNPDSFQDQPAMVLHLASTLLPAGEDDYFSRSEVATFIDPPQDLTGYASFFLRAKLDWSGAKPNLKIQLTCSRVRDAHGGVTRNPCVLWQPEMCRDVSCDWISGLTLDLTGFKPPKELVDNGGAVNSNECLAHVDGIKITVDSNASTAEGRVPFNLYVADLKFIPRTRSP